MLVILSEKKIRAIGTMGNVASKKIDHALVSKQPGLEQETVGAAAKPTTEDKKVESIGGYPKADKDGKVTLRNEEGGTIKVKTIWYVQAFGCPRVHDEKAECKHNVYIYYEDGTTTMFWGGGPLVEGRVLMDEKTGLGYKPWITIYKNDHPHLDKLQRERCEVAKNTPLERHKVCPWSGARRAPVGTSTIYYQFQSGTGVPAVYCTKCGLEQNFCYSSKDEVAAWWSSPKKERVLCHICAKVEGLDESKGLVRLTFCGDMPADRSCPLPEETGLWNNHRENVCTFAFRFCEK